MPQTPDSTNLFQPLVAAGYPRLLPVIPPGASISPHSKYLFKRVGTPSDPRGKVPGVLNGDGSWHGINFTKTQSDPDQIRHWASMGASCGVRLGQGLAAIDVDTIQPEVATRIVGLVEQFLGLQLPKRYGRRPKVLMPIRVLGDFTYQNVRFLTELEQDPQRPALVELLAEGKHFVAAGIHPVTGRPYEWPDGVPTYDDLPRITAAQLDALFALLADDLKAISTTSAAGLDRESVNQEALRAPVDLVAEALAMVPNTSDHFPARDDWLNMGYAIKAACGPGHDAEAFDLWLAWSGRWEDGDNDHDEAEANWDRMHPPFGVGASWIFDRARRLGGWTGEAAQWFEPLPAISDVFENPFWEAAQREREVESRGRFVFRDFAGLAGAALTASAAPLVKGLLDCGALSCTYGDSNVGKTFVVMDMAYHIATGRPYGGLKVARADVLYIAAEGGGGVAKRVKALLDKYGDPGPGFDVLPESVDLLDPHTDVDALLAAIEARGRAFGFVVVDTLARAMAGGDESAAQDMGAVIRNVDRIRRATGAHVMLIHHTGKKVENGARGSSALRAALDTEILVADRVVAVTKQRDLDGEWSRAFDLEVRALGLDADGDAVSSCTVRLVDETGRNTAHPAFGAVVTPLQRLVLDAVAAVSAADPAGATRKAVASFLGEKNEASVGTRLAQLLHKGVLERGAGRGKFLPAGHHVQDNLSLTLLD